MTTSGRAGDFRGARLFSGSRHVVLPSKKPGGTKPPGPKAARANNLGSQWEWFGRPAASLQMWDRSPKACSGRSDNRFVHHMSAPVKPNPPFSGTIGEGIPVPACSEGAKPEGRGQRPRISRIAAFSALTWRCTTGQNVGCGRFSRSCLVPDRPAATPPV